MIMPMIGKTLQMKVLAWDVSSDGETQGQKSERRCSLSSKSLVSSLPHAVIG
jgi:hypothetical protein